MEITLPGVFDIGTKTIRNQTSLWKEFWIAWEELAWDKKFAWILFVGNTLAIITIIELLILGH